MEKFYKKQNHAMYFHLLPGSLLVVSPSIVIEVFEGSLDVKYIVRILFIGQQFHPDSP